MTTLLASAVIGATVEAVLMRQAGLPAWAIEHALVTQHGMTSAAARPLLRRVLARVAAARTRTAPPPVLDAPGLYGDCLPLRWCPHPTERS